MIERYCSEEAARVMVKYMYQLSMRVLEFLSCSIGQFGQRYAVVYALKVRINVYLNSN